MRIVEVSATPYRSSDVGRPPSWLSESRIANPMSIYPEYAERRSSWTARFPGILVRVSTDEGLVGLGTSVGGAAAAAIVNGHLAQLLKGQDPKDIERLWDQMWRASLPHGRRGLPVMAISGVDEALWDLLGKAAGEPVYRLLGGSCRADLPVYQTTNDPTDWTGLAGVGVKLAIPYGPADGRPGMLANVDLVRSCRESIGPERDIMLDCYMAWDVEYTRRMVHLVEDLGVRWVEEPLPPDDYHGYERLAGLDSPVVIATGEHEYSRWGFVTLINTGGVTVLQPDVAWVGGISEARRICHLASCYHLMVVPHAGALQAGALHLMRSQVNTPLAEWVRTWDRAAGKPVAALDGLPEPVDGRITPSDEPGLGLRIGSLVELGDGQTG
ncbi:MAG: L-rhamnonate dehydratase [Actinomycetota bacterium]|nr:L-rhamnonate dehydratase [Actinomycetota bacterium]